MRDLKIASRKIIVTIIAILFSTLPLFGQEVPLADETGHSPFVKVAKEVLESVVNVQVEWETEMPDLSKIFPFNDEFFKFFFHGEPRLPQQRKSVSLGSGFMFRKDGRDVYILTNYHVIGKSKEGKITITLLDGEEYNGELVGVDEKTDIAVLKITVEKDKEVTLVELGDSDIIEVGDWVIAIGSPFSPNLSGTVTIGVVSAKGRTGLYFGEDSPVYQDYIQTDAAINPGNSGGPLVGIDGKVVGVNAAISTVSGGNIGIGFAIPVNIAQKSATDLIEKGYVERAYLGILPQAISPDIQKTLDLPSLKGVLIAKVEEDTPAEKAGLKRGDIIIEFDGQPVDNADKFRLMVANADIGKTVEIKILRDGKELIKKATLTPYPETTPARVPPKEETHEWLGIDVQPLDSDFAKRLDVKADHGVIVSKIAPGSPAEESALQVGDVILEINNEPIKNIDDYYEIIDRIKEEKKKSILTYVLSGNDYYHYVAIQLREEE
ncbi:MAG: trypsin-like peptidase domain-containing protein [Candidatus Cloacimonadia bacterium]